MTLAGDEAVLAEALGAPVPTAGRSERQVVVCEVRVEPQDDRTVCGLAQIWVRPGALAPRWAGYHVMTLARRPELEATAVALTAPDDVARRLVAHALVRLAAAGVARVRAQGAPPGGHAAWGRVLGWDPEATAANAAGLAAGVARGCQAHLDEGGSPADVVAFVADLRRATGTSFGASLRRADVVGDPGGDRAAVLRFWRRVQGRIRPDELAELGPVVDGEHLGALLLDRGDPEWSGVHEFSPLAARLARALRGRELGGCGLDAGPLGV